MCALQAAEAIADQLVAFTQQLVRMPSITGKEEQVAGLLLAKLQEIGVDEAWIDGIGNVVGVLRGQGNGPDVLLNGHLDVVPAGRVEHWRYDPFGAEIDDQGNIHGRGTADMKGGLAALVFTMKLMKDLRDRGIELPGDVIFSGVIFEEAAEMFGMRYLCETTLPERGLSFDVCYLAEPTNGRIYLGHRGKVELVVTTRGRTAHSSQPWQGINALEKMLPVLDRIFNQMGQGFPGHLDLGQRSITVTNLVCRPGALSVVPDECEISVDRRYLPGENADSIVNEFEELFERLKKDDSQFDASVQVRTVLEKSYTGYEREVQKHHPMWIVERDHPFVKRTADALERVGREVDFGYWPGGVDGGMTANQMGIPTLGYSGADFDLAHTPEEHIPVKTLVEDTEAFAAILCELFSIDIAELNGD
jgi:putative selenium metabolism hydrolase